MPARSLKGMDVDALLSLRTEIDKKLEEKRGELEKQLSRLGIESNGRLALSGAVAAPP